MKRIVHPAHVPACGAASVISRVAKFAFAMVLMVAFGVICLAGLAGCTDENGDIPTKREVEKKVAESVTKEGYRLVDVVEEDTRPRKATYRFRSTDRDLEFEAVSTLVNFGLDGSKSGFYTPSVSCNYVPAVRNYYADRLQPMWDQTGLTRDGKSRLWISSYEDIPTAAKAIAAASSVYGEERRYNSQDWIDANLDITFAPYTDRTPDGKGLELANLPWDGVTKSGAKHVLEMNYARLISEGKVLDDSSIPESVRKNVHKQTLDNIVVKGTALTAEMGNRETGTEYNQDKKVFTASYDYEAMDYLVTLDAAVTEVRCGPHSLQVYVEAMGGTIDVKYGRGHAKWTIDGDVFELRASTANDDSVRSFEVTKNGKALGITYLRGIGARYLVRVPVSELCRMLNATADADEKTGTLRLS